MIKNIEPSTSYRFLNGAAIFANKIFFDVIKKYMAKKMLPQKEPIEFPKKFYGRVNIKKEIFEGRPVYKLTPKENVGASYSRGKKFNSPCAESNDMPAKNKKEIIFIHGGGGMMVPTKMHFNSAVTIVEKTGIHLNFLMYPLAEKANAEIAYDWLKSWYEEKASEANDKSFYVIGDSAGANLAASLLSGGAKNMAGVVLISPAAGIDKIDESLSQYDGQDILLSTTLLKNIAKYWGRGMDLKDFRINSSYVDYSKFPKTILIYGGREIFLPEVENLILRMNDAGMNFDIYKGKIHCHDWALAQMFPEAKAVLEDICKFVCK